MAEPMTTMFGKAYDTVGSADRNLILQTRGDLKVKWGNKYIDLIKNGKINVDVDLLKKVSSLEDIVKDGIYLIEDEKTKEVWVSVGGTKINVLGEVTNNYVAFVKEQDVDAENKLRALSNIGFFYKTLDDAKKALLTLGIFFLLDQNKLYFVENGEYKEYVYTPTLEIPNPLVVGSITLNGTTSEISTPQELGIVVENNRYISITNNKISVDKEIVTSNAISSDNYVSNSKGFSIYYDNNNYIGEFDVIKVRKVLIYDEILNVTYDELKKLISENKLYPNKKYRITDFFNEWDYYKYTINGTDSKLYYFPIVVTAKNSNELKPKGYLCDREDWVIEYDVSFNYLIDEVLDLNNYVEIYTKGRITKLTDEFGNSANYDFKHRLFKYNASDDRKNWYYTYNVIRTINPTSSKDVNNWEYIHSNWDASQDGNITNNNINLPEPTTENYTLHSGKVVQKLVQNDDYILFPNCSTIYPHDNTILDSQGKYTITGNFYNNTFLGLYDNSELEVQFTLDFHDNIFLKVKNCVLNAPMQYNTFDRNLVNVAFRCTSMSNNHITGIIYTNNARDSYPILVANFNNNIINNINMSAINCSGCDIANNIINNINGCAITNSTLTDITMKDITGDGLYETNPTDNIDDSSPVNPGGDTPVNPGGDPVNPSGDSIEYYGTTWYTTPRTSPGNGYTQYSIVVNNITYYAWLPDTIDVNGVTYSTTLPTSPGSDYTLSTIQRYSINYYAWINSNSGETPTEDSTLDTFINNITGGGSNSKISTVLTNVISASNTPNTYSYLQSGYNYVSGKSDATKSWMLANMLAELTPYVNKNGGNFTIHTEIAGDTATNYFVNAAKCYGGLKLDYLANEQTYMDRINGAVEYAKFKHDNYSSSNSAADAARAELYNKGVTQAVMVNDGDSTHEANPYFTRDAAVHSLPIVPTELPTNSSSGGDWLFTQSMITQYPTPASMSGINYQPLMDKETSENYFCNILGLKSKYISYLYTCNDVGDAAGNQIKASYARPRPGTLNNLNIKSGSTTFNVPSGGSVYLCDCSIEFSDQSLSDYGWSTSYDCSAVNNGETYCLKDTRQFTDDTSNSTVGSADNPYKSYSSGHSSRAFTNLLLIIEAAGDSMNKDGYTSRATRIHQYCLNRAIMRAHWKSDTIAGRFAASILIGFLNGFNELREEIAKL